MSDHSAVMLVDLRAESNSQTTYDKKVGTRGNLLHEFSS